MRHYYAEYNRYGLNSNGPARNHEFHRFDTRAERDKWVLDNQYDSFGFLAAAKCTRAIVERNLGLDFLVTADGLCFESW